MGIPEHKLIQDVSVRWNSSYHMISRLIEQRWSLTATLSDPEVTQRAKHFLDLKPEQWSLLEELEQALKPFDCATVYLSRESYVTLSSLPALIKGLMKSTELKPLITSMCRHFRLLQHKEYQQGGRLRWPTKMLLRTPLSLQQPWIPGFAD